jgi:hypothetical protein
LVSFLRWFSLEELRIANKSVFAYKFLKRDPAGTAKAVKNGVLEE